MKLVYQLRSKRTKAQHSIAIPALLVLIIVFHLFATGCIRKSQSDSDPAVHGPAIFLFIKLDGELPQLSAFICNPDQTPLVLRPGRYYAEALHPEGSITAFPAFDIPENDQGDASFVPSSLSYHTLSGSAPQQELEAIARFLIAVDNVRLTYFEIASGGYQYPLPDLAVTPAWEDADRLLNTFNNLGDEIAVTNAARNFIERGLASAGTAGKAGLARPVSGPLDIIKSIAAFFGIIRDEEEIARQELIKILSADKTPTEAEELFEIIKQSNPQAGSSLPDIINKLENNEVKNLTQIRHELIQNSSVFYGIWHDLNPKSNRPDGEIIHRVGAEAINRGAELNVTIIKEVLSTVFPGMEQGFEYADKVDKFAEFVRELYQNPTGAVGEAIQGQIEDNIKNRIKEQFMDLFPDIEEGDAETLTNNLVDQMNQVLESQASLVNNEEESSETTQQAEKPTRVAPEMALNAETFTENGQTYRFFEGRGSPCDEAEGTFIYRWSLDLMEEVGRDLVMGTVKFHNCPQGGRVLYRVEGFIDDEGFFSMVGTKKDGGGDLNDNTPSSATFTFDPNTGVLTPNYAP